MYGFKEIEIGELQGLLSDGVESLRLIDVRSPAEVQRGAIPGADNLPLHVLPVRADEVEEDKTIVFYCQSGARSAQACAFMASRGYENVFNLRGGIMAWLQSGQAVA